MCSMRWPPAKAWLEICSAAYENLKRAIDLQPRNRLAARQDPDFAAMAGPPGVPPAALSGQKELIRPTGRPRRPGRLYRDA